MIGDVNGKILIYSLKYRLIAKGGIMHGNLEYASKHMPLINASQSAQGSDHFIYAIAKSPIIDTDRR